MGRKKAELGKTKGSYRRASGFSGADRSLCSASEKYKGKTGGGNEKGGAAFDGLPWPGYEICAFDPGRYDGKEGFW